MTHRLLSRETCIACLIILASASQLDAAVFQFAVPVPTKKGERMAFLWVPPKSTKVQGVVIGGMTLMEREFAQDERIRRACASQDLSLVFLKCGLGATDIQHVLDRLAEKSGYVELSKAPLMFIGHSAGGPQARKRAREFADRCFGLVQYRGADPGDVDHDGKEGIPPGIPALMMIGQFDEFGKIGRDKNDVENWEKDRDKLAKFRAANPRNLGSILVEPGAGHFAWSDRNAEYLSLFIPSAAKARIPKGWSIDDKAELALHKVDVRKGWLTDLDLRNSKQHSPGSYDQFAGEKDAAAWHLDEKLAQASVAYHASINREDQFITWRDDFTVNAGARNFFDSIDWSDDGTTFSVHPIYAATYPQQLHGRGSRWGKAGQPVGHSSNSIHVKHVSGPITLVGKNSFRIQHNELAPAMEKARATFMAFSKGDQQYRYTERVGMMNSNLFAIDDGKPQAISFQPLSDMQPDSNPQRLTASSDQELPVAFHVAYGPAKIIDGQLHLTDIPRQARYPIRIKVIAYQTGRPVEPRIQAATPIEHSLRVVRP